MTGTNEQRARELYDRIFDAIAEDGSAEAEQDCIRAIAAALAEPKAGAVPDGWQLVPKEPTQEMVEEAAYLIDDMQQAGQVTANIGIAVYTSMIQSARTADRCTDPINCRRCSEDADTPHAGIARNLPTAPQAKLGEREFADIDAEVDKREARDPDGMSAARSTVREHLADWRAGRVNPVSDFPAERPAEQQGQAVAWQSESMSALAQQLRSRGDDVSLDAATWLERFANPQPAAVDAVRTAAANLIAWTKSGNEVPIDLPFVFRERWEKIVADIRQLEAALTAQGREGEVG